MQVCVECGAEFASYPVINGQKLNIHGRKRCLDCRPIRRLARPRKKVERPPLTKICESCGDAFPAKLLIDGKVRSLYRRRFCLKCSPFGAHNTAKAPLTSVGLEALKEQRRRRRNAKTYRSLKKRRLRRKAELVASSGGRCVDCGYATCLAALEFHHRDASTKEFGIGNFSGSLKRLIAEVEKCDLLCASCHRMRHALREASSSPNPVVEYRRRRKLRAIEYMGSACFACNRSGPASLFEFHHWDATQKEFGLSRHGIPHSWTKTVVELEKCVMLCANCHREAHASVLELDEGVAALDEDEQYVA